MTASVTLRLTPLVWKKQYLGLSDKLLDTVLRPYPINTVHTNGTVTIQLTPVTTERINIRRILPKRRLVTPRQRCYLVERESEAAGAR